MGNTPNVNNMPKLDIWFTNPFAIAWRVKLQRKKNQAKWSKCIHYKIAKAAGKECDYFCSENCPIIENK